MFRPVIPKNVKVHRYEYRSLNEIPQEIFDKIKKGFEDQQADNPLISVNIIAWNEESNILRNLSSLSQMKCSFPVEYIFVDNNSKDKTSEIITRCGIKPIFEQRQGYGFARQAALENSKGKYIITGDADTIYPPTWIETMLNPILKGDVFGTFGTYSFIPGKGKSRLRFAIYEFFRDIIHARRARKYPELTVGGVNFCFPRKDALEIGFIKSDSRMEDGQMAYALLQRGKLRRITNIEGLAWTVTRSVERSGSFFSAILQRIVKESKRITIYFNKE